MGEVRRETRNVIFSQVLTATQRRAPLSELSVNLGVVLATHTGYSFFHSNVLCITEEQRKTRNIVFEYTAHERRENSPETAHWETWESWGILKTFPRFPKVRGRLPRVRDPLAKVELSQS